MNIGNNLATIRKSKNLTQEELAKLINVSPKTISSYETNRSIPNIEILILLTKALDTNIETILNLNKDNTLEIKKIYEKKHTKETILKTIFLSLILIIPVIYFIYSAYVSISSMAAGLYNNITTIDEIARQTFTLFLMFCYGYLMYILSLILNYILYKKKCLKTLFILNGLLLIVLIMNIISIIFFDSSSYDLFLFFVSALIGLIFAFKLLKQQKTSKI